MLEWCCNPGSLIARYSRRTPHTKAVRLGLHNIDLADAVQVAKLRRMGSQYLESNGALRVFVSIPCTCWCKMQSLMMRLFLSTYRQWKRESPTKVSGAFEWPQNLGWNSDQNSDITGLLKTLPYNALFDGCAFGLKYKGSYLKKPWRIATDHARLAAALDGQFCRGDHSHAVTVGKAAKASESYPPRLARCITDAFLEAL